MPKTDKERHETLRERDKVRGVISTKVRIPEGRLEELRAICKEWRIKLYRLDQ